MLETIIKRKNYQDTLKILRDAVNQRKVRFPKNFPQTVFLCGANQCRNKISARRENLLAFAKKKLPETKFFLAEDLQTIKSDFNDRSMNLLDWEGSLSEFADRIVIILESPSAFAELGAFCRESLREKLIVINDRKYINSESFINLGPIKAVKNASGDDYVISYTMKDDGVKKVDSIGEVYQPLTNLLRNKSQPRFTHVTIECCSPVRKNFNKYSVMMMHDLIYMCGPILHRELVAILKSIFGDKSFDISNHTAILEALQLVSRCKEDELYRSKSDTLFFKYSIDTDKVVSKFRNHMQIHCPNRIYGY